MGDDGGEHGSQRRELRAGALGTLRFMQVPFGYFNTDAESIVVGVLVALARDGHIPFTVAREAADKYQITDVSAAEVSYADTGSA